MTPDKKIPMTGEYVAVVGNGSWGGEGKIHAAERGSGELPTSGPSSYRSGLRYKSRCGQRFCKALKDEPDFTTTIHLDQCQRCLKLVTRP